MNKGTILLLEKQIGLLLCFIFTLYNKAFGSTPKSKQPESVLFVKFIEQGALVLHLPAFTEAVRVYGVNQVYCCTFLSNAPLLKTLNIFSENNIFFIDEKTLWTFSKSFLQSIAKIRKANISAAIDLEFFSRATAVFCYLTGIKIRAGYHRYMGLQNYRGNLFTHRLSYSHYEHVSQTGKALLKAIQVDSQELPTLSFSRAEDITKPQQYQPQPDALQQVHGMLTRSAEHPRKIVVINPSFNDQLPLRKWPEENYLACCKAILESHPDVVFAFTGRTDEASYTDQYIQRNNIKNAINLCGKTTLDQLLTLYSISQILITSDSGPAHFATLTEINIIVLFGPETPDLYAPIFGKVHVVYTKQPCSPCFNVYNNRLSPCKSNLCMQTILPDVVSKLAVKLMNS